MVGRLSFDPLSEAMVLRNVAVAAFHVDDLEKSWRYIKHAIDALTPHGETLLRLQYMADSAYVAWHRKDQKSTIEILADLLGLLPKYDGDIRYRGLIRSIGHFILWLVGRFEPGSSYSQLESLPPGYFSEHEAQKKMQELENHSVVNLWSMLSELEWNVSDNHRIFDTAVSHSTKMDRLFANKLSLLDVKWSLRTNQLENIQEKFVEWVLATVRETELNDTGSNAIVEQALKSLDGWLIGLTAACILTMHGAPHTNKNFILETRAFLRRIESRENTKLEVSSTIEWIGSYELLSISSEFHLAELVAGQDIPNMGRLAAATILFHSAKTPFHFFIATAYLFGWLTKDGSFLAESIQNCYCKLVCDRWLKFCEENRFAIMHPDLTCEQLHSVITNAEGLSGVASAILATRTGVKVNLPDELLNSLQAYAGDHRTDGPASARGSNQ